MRTEIITQAFTNNNEFRDIVGKKLQLYDFLVVNVYISQHLLFCVELLTKCSVRAIHINSNSKYISTYRLDTRPFMIVTDQIKYGMSELYSKIQTYIDMYEKKKLEKKIAPKDVNFVLFSFVNREIINSNLTNMKVARNKWSNNECDPITLNDINNIKFAIEPSFYNFSYNRKVESVKAALNNIINEYANVDDLYILTKDNTFIKVKDVKKASSLKLVAYIPEYILKHRTLYYDKSSVDSKSSYYYTSNKSITNLLYKYYTDDSYYCRDQISYFDYDKMLDIFNNKGE